MFNRKNIFISGPFSQPAMLDYRSVTPPKRVFLWSWYVILWIQDSNHWMLPASTSPMVLHQTLRSWHPEKGLKTNGFWIFWNPMTSQTFLGSKVFICSNASEIQKKLLPRPPNKTHIPTLVRFQDRPARLPDLSEEISQAKMTWFPGMNSDWYPPPKV